MMEKNLNDKIENNLFTISFAQMGGIVSLEALEKYTRIWNNVLHSFIRITNSDLNELRVYDINKNEITSYASQPAIEALTFAAKQMLAIYARNLEIKKIQLELRKIHLFREKEIDELLSKEVEENIQHNIAQLTEQLVQRYERHINDDVDKLYKDIHLSLRQIYVFLEKGGKMISSISDELKIINEEIDKFREKLAELTKAMEQINMNYNNEPMNIVNETQTF